MPRWEACHELRFRFRKVERDAVCFRHGSDEETEESEDLRPHVPAKDAAFGMVSLRVDYVAQVETARKQEHSDNGHRQSELVAHHLRRTPQTAQQRIFAVRGPARQRHSINTQRSNRKERQNANIQIGDAKSNVASE